MDKQISMKKFLKIKEENKHHFDNIKNIVLKTTTAPEGNCFWFHGSTVEAEEFIFKQYNLYYLGIKAENIIEIGFNAGHSALLMLLGNTTSKIIIFDICEHSYTRDCFSYLDEQFPNRLELIVGNSLETIPAYYNQYSNKIYDLIHIDGFHIPDHVRKDFNNVRKLAVHNGIVILDDDNLQDLFKLHREFIEYEFVKIHEDPMLFETQLYTHLVCKFL